MDRAIDGVNVKRASAEKLTGESGRGGERKEFQEQDTRVGLNRVKASPEEIEDALEPRENGSASPFLGLRLVQVRARERSQLVKMQIHSGWTRQRLSKARLRKGATRRAPSQPFAKEYCVAVGR